MMMNEAFVSRRQRYACHYEVVCAASYELALGSQDWRGLSCALESLQSFIGSHSKLRRVIRLTQQVAAQKRGGEEETGRSGPSRRHPWGARWGWEEVDGLSTMEQVEKIPRCTDLLLSVSDRTPPDLAHGVGMGSTR